MAFGSLRLKAEKVAVEGGNAEEDCSGGADADNGEVCIFFEWKRR